MLGGLTGGEALPPGHITLWASLSPARRLHEPTARLEKKSRVKGLIDGNKSALGDEDENINWFKLKNKVVEMFYDIENKVDLVPGAAWPLASWDEAK